MDRIAIAMILTGVVVSLVGIVVLGGTLLGEWFGPESRHVVRNVAAVAPFFGLVLLGCGGSRCRPTSPRVTS